MATWLGCCALPQHSHHLRIASTCADRAAAAAEQQSNDRCTRKGADAAHICPETWLTHVSQVPPAEHVGGGLGGGHHGAVERRQRGQRVPAPPAQGQAHERSRPPHRGAAGEEPPRPAPLPRAPEGQSKTQRTGCSARSSEAAISRPYFLFRQLEQRQPSQPNSLIGTKHPTYSNSHPDW